MKLRPLVLLIAVTLCLCSLEAAPPAAAQGPVWESHCTEPLPVFTLGKNSSPTEAQEANLCACIWDNLGGGEREVSEKIAQGKPSEVSEMQLSAFTSHFKSALEKCGGMKL
jgi:hypothetical protein